MMDQRHSPKSQWPSLGYSTNDLGNEHRITVLEISEKHQQKFNSKVKNRLWYIEKTLQALVTVAYMYVNGKAHAEWAPHVAELLFKLIKTGP
jgi:hypothetical protein